MELLSYVGGQMQAVMCHVAVLVVQVACLRRHSWIVVPGWYKDTICVSHSDPGLILHQIKHVQGCLVSICEEETFGRFHMAQSHKYDIHTAWGSVWQPA